MVTAAAVISAKDGHPSLGITGNEITVGTSGHGSTKMEILDTKLHPVRTSHIGVFIPNNTNEMNAFNMIKEIFPKGDKRDITVLSSSHKEEYRKGKRGEFAGIQTNYLKYQIKVIVSKSNSRYAVKKPSGWKFFRSASGLRKEIYK